MQIFLQIIFLNNLDAINYYCENNILNTITICNTICIRICILYVILYVNTITHYRRSTIFEVLFLSNFTKKVDRRLKGDERN